jgi:predicted nucleic acid-binding protein
MTVYFLDSSALAKRYIAEIGTPWIRTIVSPKTGNTIFIAQITPIEIVSGSARRKRDGSITSRTARAVRLLVDRHAQREYIVVGLVEQIVQRAENLLEVYTLRAYDAVQLASALESNSRLLSTGLSALTFVSADTRLLNTASTEGLATDDPNAHP